MVTVYSFWFAYVNVHNTRSAAVLRPNKFKTMHAIGQTHTAQQFFFFFSLVIMVERLPLEFIPCWLVITQWKKKRNTSIHLAGNKCRCHSQFITFSYFTFENKIIKYYLCISYLFIEIFVPCCPLSSCRALVLNRMNWILREGKGTLLWLVCFWRYVHLKTNNIQKLNINYFFNNSTP